MYGAFLWLLYLYMTWKSKEVVRRRDVLKPSYVGEGRLFLWDAVDHSRHHAYNLQPGNYSLVN